jgi:hypothetical protein
MRRLPLVNPNAEGIWLSKLLRRHISSFARVVAAVKAAPVRRAVREALTAVAIRAISTMEGEGAGATPLLRFA